MGLLGASRGRSVFREPQGIFRARVLTRRERAADEIEWLKKPGLYAASNLANCRKRVLVLLDDVHVCHAAAIDLLQWVWSYVTLLHAAMLVYMCT